jgi:hypothetical protein
MLPVCESGITSAMLINMQLCSVNALWHLKLISVHRNVMFQTHIQNIAIIRHEPHWIKIT